VADYESERNGYQRPLDPVQVAAIESLVVEHQPERILEVGCATGRLLGRLDYSGSSLVGLDLSPVALQRVAINSQAPVVQGNAEAMPFADESFDLIVANHIIEHTDDADRLMAEIARVTCPEGLVFLSYPNEPIRGMYASLGSFLMYGHPFGGRRMHLRKVRPDYFDDIPGVPSLKHVGSRHSWLPMPQYFTTLAKLAT
jgi:SAM-dependent methyltransferase